MLIDAIEIENDVVLHVREDVAAGSNLDQLKTMIFEYLKRGPLDIAVSFSPQSYLHTHTITTLVQCIKAVHERGGMLGVIDPNPDIRDALTTISLDKLIRLIPSESSAG